MNHADFPLRRIDHVRFFVGNARQSAYFYRNAFGFDVIAYAGLETRSRHEAGYVLRQGDITFVLASPLGLLLALIPRAIYSFYVHAPRTWGPKPLADQQIAGVTMAAEEALVFFGVFTAYLLRFLADEQAASSPRPSPRAARSPH